LLNVMRNGIEAMSMYNMSPESGQLTIKLDQIDDQMQIQVIDIGPGISPAVQEKLFTPFFSTKNEGMGMGLNICRSIIEFHRGRLWVEDNPKGGTIIAISLPITQP
jgi:two-component system, LuxR family, sensor histidine kinase DctS